MQVWLSSNVHAGARDSGTSIGAEDLMVGGTGRIKRVNQNFPCAKISSCRPLLVLLEFILHSSPSGIRSGTSFGILQIAYLMAQSPETSQNVAGGRGDILGFALHQMK